MASFKGRTYFPLPSRKILPRRKKYVGAREGVYPSPSTFSSPACLYDLRARPLGRLIYISASALAALTLSARKGQRRWRTRGKERIRRESSFPSLGSFYSPARGPFPSHAAAGSRCCALIFRFPREALSEGRRLPLQKRKKMLHLINKKLRVYLDGEDSLFFPPSTLLQKRCPPFPHTGLTHSPVDRNRRRPLLLAPLRLHLLLFSPRKANSGEPRLVFRKASSQLLFLAPRWRASMAARSLSKASKPLEKAGRGGEREPFVREK